MARDRVTDDVWADFRTLAAPDTSAQALGAPVRPRRARQLKAGRLDGTEFADALERARELHADLTALVERLERRLDHQAPTPLDLGR